MLEFAELEQFGWNVLTFSFLATLVFTFLGAWGLLDQIRKVWRGGSGESIPIAWYLAFLFMYGAFLIYGFHEHSLAILLHTAVRAPLVTAVLIGLLKFKKMQFRDKLTAAVFAIVFAFTAALPQKDIMFIVFSAMGAVISALQPWEIWKNKYRGAVSLRLLIIYATSAAFWAVYGLAKNDNAIVGMSFMYIPVYITAIILWIKYPKRPPRKLNRLPH